MRGIEATSAASISSTLGHPNFSDYVTNIFREKKKKTDENDVGFLDSFCWRNDYVSHIYRFWNQILLSKKNRKKT